MKVPQFEHVIGVVSSYALDLIVTELERFDDYTYISIQNCGCFLRKTHGLPCAHELRYYFSNGESIQPDEIDVFWRTLEIRKSNQFTNVEGVSYHSPSNINEPLVRKETRGRPRLGLRKKTTQQDFVPQQESRRHSVSSYTPVMADLNANVPVEDEWRSSSSRFEFDFLNQILTQDNFQPYPQSDFQQEPFMQDINNNSFTEPTSSTYPFIFQEQKTFMDQIPSIFRSFVRDINDVIGDGNCGFRSVAIALGRHEDEWRLIRQELYHELMSGKYNNVFCEDFERIQRSIAEDYRWMMMPDTGYLIAERYKCIVNFIHLNESSTCFSLFTPPPQTPNYPEMTILHVNGNHFVHLKMEKNHPMGALGHLWKHKKHSCAVGWDVLYEHRLNSYLQNKHINRSYVDLGTP